MAAKLTPEACRAGRALLRWGVRDLAANAGGMSQTTVVSLESGKPHSEATAAAIVAAFAKHGVEITNGDGTGARLLAGKRRNTTKSKRKV